MKITRVELDNIKKSNDLSSDIEAYEWILSTYTESVFFDNIEIMELINEAKEKLDLEKQKIIVKGPHTEFVTDKETDKELKELIKKLKKSR